MPDYDATKLPLGAFINGRLIPAGEDLLAIEVTIDRLEKRCSELEAMKIRLPWQTAELREVRKHLVLLFAAKPVAQDYVWKNSVSSELYAWHKKQYETRMLDQALAAQEPRVQKAALERQPDPQALRLTPEQKLHQRRLDEMAVAAQNKLSVLPNAPASPSGGPNKRTGELTPEQKLLQRAISDAMARSPAKAPPPQGDLSAKQPADQDKDRKREQVDRWVFPASFEDMDFEDSPGKR